jgi:hypothetical protein
MNGTLLRIGIGVASICAAFLLVDHGYPHTGVITGYIFGAIVGLLLASD